MSFTTRKPKTSSATFSEPERDLFISRDLSWLDFNARVLDEAGMQGNPLLERLKFISIFSSNLDEFFMVRVAGLRHKTSGKTHIEGIPAAEPEEIRRKVSSLLKKQYSLLYDRILPELSDAGIKLCTLASLPEKSRKRLRKFFINEILPVLTPLTIVPEHPFPLLNSGSIELAIQYFHPQSRKISTACVEIPGILDRFIPLDKQKQEFILLEELIAGNIDALFPGKEIKALQIFRLTRDMDFTLDPEDSEDLLHILQDKLRQRSSGEPVRLEFSTVFSSKELQKFLIAGLQVDPRFCYTLHGALHLKQFFSLADQVDRQDLLEAPWEPVIPPCFNEDDTVFETVARKKNILLFHPYHSFEPILKLLESAADDPDVIAIKQTLYRVGGNSPVVKALRRAAEKGKQVTAVVELKARFDEENNIAWAELLDHSGAHVVYGSAELKVHSKVLLIIRREKGRLRRYVHFGTGNYNDRTARQYADVSLLSCDEALCDDAATLFNLLSSKSEPVNRWKALAVAPFDLRQTLVRLIKKETALGKKGRIIAKMNSFSDPELIRLIRRAADAGVQIDLIVRGICCCRIKKNMKNLRIISIIDRYLEHSRIFFFGSEPDIYCSSADWMPRNLNRRVETIFPVSDPVLKSQLLEILEYHLLDHAKQRQLTASGSYTCPAGEKFDESRSQKKIYEMCRRMAAK